MNDDGTARAGEATRAALTGRNGIVHAQTRALSTYWESLRAGQLVPFRSQVDPRQMRCDVGSLFIIEALPDGAQRFRLAGSRIVDMFGMELRGMPVRSIMAGEAREALRALIAGMLEEPAQAYARLRPEAGSHALWEMSLLPLRSDDGTIDRGIGLIFQLAGGRSIDGLMPLRLTFERRSLVRIEPPARVAGDAAAGFGEPPAGFAGPEPGGLTAIEGGGSGERTSALRQRPAFRVVGKD